ncbi:hypothetical protein K1719_035005 [Acacia pycnantha]|nr:hypothetical protein K1719_035005 [Acacia pycnantha]
MASLTHFFLLSLSLLLSLFASSSNAQLSPNFYARSCPNLQAIVRSTMSQALAREPDSVPPSSVSSSTTASSMAVTPESS